MIVHRVKCFNDIYIVVKGNIQSTDHMLSQSDALHGYAHVDQGS